VVVLFFRFSGENAFVKEKNYMNWSACTGKNALTGQVMFTFLESNGLFGYLDVKQFQNAGRMMVDRSV